jgi:two-component system, NarL family, nitrate/nitrite response regulator NarL
VGGVLICSPIRLYGHGLGEALAGRSGVEVSGTASSPSECMSRADELDPEVVLIDLAMQDSVEIIRWFATGTRDVKVVALGVREAEEDVIACAEAGVSAYVTRNDSLDDLMAVLASVGRGEALCSPKLTAMLLRRVAALSMERGERSPAELVRLTPREREVLRLLDEGLSNKQISQRLCIEVATVKNHVHNILEKLSVHRRGEAVAWLHTRAVLNQTI